VIHLRIIKVLNISDDTKINFHVVLSSLLLIFKNFIAVTDELDESILLGWLKENVGDKEESLKVLNAVQLKLDKTRSLIDELRAMGHDITDDHYVDLNFFSAD
jgi:hypothetical protein